MRRHRFVKTGRGESNGDNDSDDTDIITSNKTQTPSSPPSNAAPAVTRGMPRGRVKINRVDTPTLEKIEKGSVTQQQLPPGGDDRSANSDVSDEDDQSFIREHGSPRDEETDGVHDDTKKKNRKSLLVTKEIDVEKYMARREMTPLQERINAITVMPGAFYCAIFLLSGAWIDKNLVEESGNEMIPYADDESACLSYSWLPSMHAMPPLPAIAVAIGIIIHFPFSFIYHWHYAHRLPPGLARTTHWSRRMDQAMIHAQSACLSYAMTGRFDYFLVNVIFNLVCARRLFQPRVYPRLNQMGVIVSMIAYTVPIVRRGDVFLFSELWVAFGICAWLFAAYPIGGWSHAVFHVGLAFVPPMLMAGSLEIAASQDQLKVAARCAFLGGKIAS